MGKRKRTTFYAVAQGRETGIYHTWEECEKQVKGYSGALFKSFPTVTGAELFLQRCHQATDPSSPDARKYTLGDEIGVRSLYMVDRVGVPSARPRRPSSSISPAKKKCKYSDYFDSSESSQNEDTFLPQPKDIVDLTGTPSTSPRTSITFLPTSPEVKKEKKIPVQPLPPAEEFIPLDDGDDDTENLSTAEHDFSRDLESLNETQRSVYDLVMKGKSVFFTGSAGTGKSYLLRVIAKSLRKKFPEGLFVTASTGVAAIQVGGQTVHSFAGIGLGNLPLEELQGKAFGRKKAWRDCRALIIDEISMISGKLFDDLEEIARVVREGMSMNWEKKPFGGIQLIVCGDFFQLPPVKRSEKFAFQANSWKQCIPHTVELTHIYRQKEVEFVDCLNQLRHGVCSIRSAQYLSQASRPLCVDDGVLPTRLYCTNVSVDEENRRELALIQSPELHLVSTDRDQYSIRRDDRARLWPLIQRCQKTSTVPDDLVLKVGAQVMLLRNMKSERLVNGSRGVVIEFESYTREQLFAMTTEDVKDLSALKQWIGKQQLDDNVHNTPVSGEVDKEPIFLPRVRFANGVVKVIFPVTMEALIDKETEWYRIQIPLRLSWAITIHKSQGLTLDRCTLDLSKVFEAGQAYVALSRASNLDGLELRGFSSKCVFADQQVLQFYADECGDPLAKKILQYRVPPKK